MGTLRIEGNAGQHFSPLFFSMDSQRLFVWTRTQGEEGAAIREVDIKTGDTEEMFVGRRVFSAALSSNGKSLAILHGDTTTIFDMSTKGMVSNFNIGEMANTIAYSPVKAQVLIGYGDELLRLWDVQSKSAVATMRPNDMPGNGTNQVAFTPDGRFLVGITPWRVRLWDGSEEYRLVYEDETVTQYLDTDMAVTPCSTRLAWLESTGGDTEASCTILVSIFHILQGKKIGTWGISFDDKSRYYDTCAIRSIDIASNGRLVVAGGSFVHRSPEDFVYIWDIRAPFGSLNRDPSFLCLKKVEQRITWVRFSPDCKWIAFAGQEGDRAVITIFKCGNFHFLDNPPTMTLIPAIRDPGEDDA